ncbi:Alpha/Beta hydrolase protein [Zopfochytrium polystomum]|nr:Alpha/Beta hydrolase protein [Zopfochytrium polystomum]
MASTAPSCCTLAPVHQGYTSKGEVITLPGTDLKVYLTGPKGAKNAIIFNYDIFGDHPNTRQVADILGTHNFRVAVPDLLHGDPWPTSPWPPASFDEVFKHIFSVAPYDRVVKEVGATREYLKTVEGAEKFGLVGFCWGGRNVALLTQDPVFSAAALVHPGAVSEAEAEKVSAPLLVMPAKDDSVEVFEKLVAVVRAKPFGDRVEYHRFDDVPHGFCASRSDFSDPLMAKRANEAIAKMHDFFVKNL